jgi:hypothetical protein
LGSTQETVNVGSFRGGCSAANPDARGILVEGADDLAPGEVPVEADEDGGEVRLSEAIADDGTAIGDQLCPYVVAAQRGALVVVEAPELDFEVVADAAERPMIGRHIESAPAGASRRYENPS